MQPQLAILRPYAELPTGTAIRHAIKWQIVGLLLLAGHVMLTKQSVAFFPLTLILLGVLYFYAPLAGLLVYFQLLLFQNWIIALFAPNMVPMTFTLLQGTNFGAITILACIGLTRLMTPVWEREKIIAQALWVVGIAMFLAIGYGGLGTLKEGPTSAAIYFREFMGPVFAMVVGLDVARVWGFKTVVTGFLVSAATTIIIALVELTIPLDYYSWINASSFYNLKASCCQYKVKMYSAADVLAGANANWFNISGNESTSATSFRFGSTILHAISYAYVLAVVSFAAISLRRSVWLVITIPLMFIIGVKGAAILFISTVLLWWTWTLSRSTIFVVTCGLMLTVGYIGYGLLHGIEVGDYHVIGFLGGVNGFMHNPFGHGLGVGGNLSANAATDAGGYGVNWTGQGGFQAAGADFAVESAVGVLIYQMGIGSLAIFAVFIIMLKEAPFLKLRRPRPRRYDIWYFALAAVMVNGVFQEEAYAPTGAGLIALFCAMLIVNEHRQAVVLSGDQQPAMVPRPMAAVAS